MLSKSGILKDGLQILERVEVSVDSDDEDFAYEEVALNDAQEDEDENELEEALASIVRTCIQTHIACFVLADTCCIDSKRDKEVLLRSGCPNRTPLPL